MKLKLVLFTFVVLINFSGILTESEINTNNSFYFRDQSLFNGNICQHNGFTGICKETRLCKTAFSSSSTLLCSDSKAHLICCPYEKNDILNTQQLEPTLTSDWKSLDECFERNIQCIDNFDLKFWNVENMPHLALLGYWYKRKPVVRCAGSLITDQFIITTAFCAGQPNAHVNFAIITDRTLKKPMKRASTISLTKVVLHHNVNLAVIKMDNKQILHRYLRPACLWPSSSQIPINLQSVSWEMGNSTQVKQEITVKSCQFRGATFCAIVSNSSNKNNQHIIESPLFYSTSEIHSEHGEDALRKQFYLIGLKDAGSNLYLNPSYEKKWIEDVINNNV